MNWVRWRKQWELWRDVDDLIRESSVIYLNITLKYRSVSACWWWLPSESFCFYKTTDRRVKTDGKCVISDLHICVCVHSVFSTGAVSCIRFDIGEGSSYGYNVKNQFVQAQTYKSKSVSCYVVIIMTCLSCLMSVLPFILILMYLYVP